MSPQNSEYQLLKLLGMSAYESKCYITLLSSFGLTVREISELSEVPRVKCYEVLDSLEARNLITKNYDRPATYSPNPPHRILNQQTSELIEGLEENFKSLQSIWESKEFPVKEPMQHFTNLNKLRILSKSILEKADRNIYFLLRFEIEEELKDIFELLKDKASKGIQITIIFHPNVIVNDKILEMAHELQNICEIKVAPIPARLLITDSSQVLLCAPPEDAKKDSIYHTMYIRIPGLVSIMEQSVRASMTQIAKALD